MKSLFFLAFLISHLCYSQIKETDPFEAQYNQLLELLTQENWTKSEQLTKKLMAYAEPVDSLDTEKKVLRYMYIYSTAGLLSERKISKEQALANVKFLKSKEMIMPAHPFNSNCHVNCTHLQEDDKNTFFTGVNNAKGTQIFTFEYVKIKNGIKESAADLEGKLITLTGELKETAVEGNLFPRFKLHFVNGRYSVSD